MQELMVFQASPFDKMRNISFRRPLSRNRARTPSLTRTVSSPSSSMSNSTPHSTRSFRYQRQESDPPLAALTVPLPRSATASPAIRPQPEERDLTQMNLSSEFPSSIYDNRLDFAQADENDTELLPEVAAERQRELEESQASRANNSHSRSREPTFSSEEAMSGDRLSPGTASRRARSPTPLSVAFSSPQSALFTPTPAFQPRPRARFGVPASSTTPALPTTTPSQHTVRFEEDVDATPHAASSSIRTCRRSGPRQAGGPAASHSVSTQGRPVHAVPMARQPVIGHNSSRRAASSGR